MVNLLDNSWLRRAEKAGLSKRSIVLIILFSLIATITEIFGIGMFLPIFQFIRMEGDINALIADSVIWQYLVSIFQYFDIKPSLFILLVIAFLFFISRQFFIYIRLIYTQAVTQQLTQSQRVNLFNRYIKSDTHYHDSMPVGNLVNIIMTEVGMAISGVMAPTGLIVYVIMLIGYMFMLLILSWQMTVASIIILLIASLAPRAWIKQSEQTGRKLVNANTLMSEFLVGRLQSPRLVRLSGTEIAEQKEFYNLTLSQRKYQMKGALLKAKTIVVMDPAVIGLSLTFLYFAHTILQLQIEIIGIYLVIALRLMPVVQSMIVQFQAIQSSLGSIDILEDHINEMKKFKEQDTGTNNLNMLNKLVLFNNVSYRYLEAKDYALKNVTLEFNTNELIAIVGPSGSGKSTLIDLLPRLRTPTSGYIHIDDIDIKDYTLKSLRKLISYAPQFPQIFYGTVRQHILYGKIDASDEEVQKAAHLSGAEDFINSLPQKYDTLLGKDAVKLSGGQRQRLDLARALVKKAPILILDEPTSNLDAESEDVFKKVIAKIQKETNTTIIIVAHGLASISDADKIVVLNKGEVESCGSHIELLNENGWYSKAWRIQKSLK
jgi:ABC-type multidrug transport system fused ATPase/permease subunit